MKNISLKLAVSLIPLLVLLSCGGGGGGSGSGSNPDTGSVTQEDETIILPPSRDGNGNDDGDGGDTEDEGSEGDGSDFQNDDQSNGPWSRQTDAEDTAATWRGLAVVSENRCSLYDRDRDYWYPQSVEQEIVRRLGGVYGPYTGTCFSSTDDTHIEHIVATSEAHDSGLCARNRTIRTRFARDLRNLTLASPEVNRRKSDHDAADWLPMRNRCWFASRIVEVRRAYGLTIDQREADALEKILSGCGSTAMESIVCQPAMQGSDEGGVPDEDDDALARYDDNGDGRITCSEARRHGIAPVSRSHPAYRYMRDGDGDGVVCE